MKSTLHTDSLTETFSYMDIDAEWVDFANRLMCRSYSLPPGAAKGTIQLSHLQNFQTRRTRKKSVNRPGRFARRPEVGVGTSEFISDGGGGEILPRRTKRCKATFCEIIKQDDLVKSFSG